MISMSKLFTLKPQMAEEIYAMNMKIHAISRHMKSRDITFPPVCIVEIMVFLIVMYRCESWIIMKAEHQKIDAFELWCWRRLSRIP